MANFRIQTRLKDGTIVTKDITVEDVPQAVSEKVLPILPAPTTPTTGGNN